MTRPATAVGEGLRRTFEQRLAATCARRGHDIEKGAYLDERAATWFSGKGASAVHEAR